MTGGALEFRNQRLVGGRQPAGDHHADLRGAGRCGKQECSEDAERKGAKIDRKPHNKIPGTTLELSALQKMYRVMEEAASGFIVVACDKRKAFAQGSKATTCPP